LPNEWIVILEVAIEPEGSVAIAEIARVLHAVGDVQGVALLTVDRYALQLLVKEEACGVALLSACSWWREALREVGLPPADVVRAEVLTVSEFQRDRQLST
jgi:hypothetical protein